MRVVLPEKSDQIAHRAGKGSRGGRPPRFDVDLDRDRNVVERAFNRLKGWRAIATRYDKHARNYPAGVVLACIALLGRRQQPARQTGLAAPGGAPATEAYAHSWCAN
jgi:transposase